MVPVGLLLEAGKYMSPTTTSHTRSYEWKDISYKASYRKVNREINAASENQ